MPVREPQSFMEAAQLRDHTIPSIPYDRTGAPRTQNLRNAGYVERLRLVLECSGTFATSGPTGVDAFGLYCGALQRLTLRANSVGMLYDVEGIIAALISAIDRQYHTQVPLTLTPSPYAHTAHGSVGTSPFTNKYVIDIPVAIYLSNQPWPLGLFQTALNAQETQLEARFNPISGSASNPGSGLYTGGVGIGTSDVGTLYIQQRYFEPIPEGPAEPNLAYIHQWRSWRVYPTGQGDFDIRLPGNNMYTRILWATVLNGALSSALTRVRLQYGANITPIDMRADDLLSLNASEYGAALPSGMYALDFLEATHTNRDWINSAATTDLRLTLTHSGGTYTGNTFIVVGVEQMIPLTSEPGLTVGGAV